MISKIFNRKLFISSSNPVLCNKILTRTLSNFQFSNQLINEIQFTFSSPAQDNLTNAEVFVLPFKQSSDSGYENRQRTLLDSIPSNLSAELRKTIHDIIAEDAFVASEDEKFVIRLQESKGKCKYIALVGLGDTPCGGLFGRSVLSVARQIKSKSVGTILPAGLCPSQIFSGIFEECYEDKRFKSKSSTKTAFSPNQWNGIQSLAVYSDANLEYLQSIAQQAAKVAKGVSVARELVGAPPNIKTPLVLSTVATDIAKNYPNFSCQILGQSECESLGMGGYLAVQQGSKFPPQFIHLTYTSASQSENKRKKVALVGKGLTFDSGGYNLKVGASSSIEMMKYDMGGSSAVLGCAQAIAELQPDDLEVHFIVAACENMISADAMRPGDIVTASNGKTIEILNTDAEGRLTLADALVYADRLQPDWIIDLATLTGACVVALGEESAGVYCDSDQLLQSLQAASQKSGDELWHMPLNKKYKKNIKSSIADIKNIGERGGGSITAALFLQEFVEGNNWAHIDMAGPVWDSKGHNPTGYGVKLLTEFLLSDCTRK